MNRLFLACRLFIALLGGRVAVPDAQRLLQPTVAPVPAGPRPTSAEVVAPVKAKPIRSEAITLLATLQRETRLVDLVSEPLSEYSDAQVGAAAREVLRDCGKVLERLFGLEPVYAQDDGSAIETPTEIDAGVIRITGNVTGTPPFRGRLVHHGWKAGRCELPQWTGTEAAARVIAPAEVEV